jgi:hypothetical protein
MRTSDFVALIEKTEDFLRGKSAIASEDINESVFDGKPSKFVIIALLTLIEKGRVVEMDFGLEDKSKRVFSHATEAKPMVSIELEI